MTKKLTLLSLIFFSSLSLASHLQGSKHSIQLGGSLNTGNAETTNVTTKFESEMEYEPWGYSLNVEGQLASSKGVESARSLKTNGEIHYTISSQSYLFTKGSIVYDKYATYNFIIREAAGMGRILLHSPIHELSMEAGPGGIHRRISGTEEFQNEPILNVSGKYTCHISDTAEFKQTLSTDFGRLNTHTEASSAISTTVIKNLAMQLSFTINHNSRIPPLSTNTKKTDTITKATIVYTF